MSALFVGVACFAAHAFASLVWLAPSGEVVAGRPACDLRARNARPGDHAGSVACGAVGLLAGGGGQRVRAVCWLFAFSAVYKSVSLRILTQLARTPGHSLPLGAITVEYVRPEFEARVALLVRVGWAEWTADGILVTESGQRAPPAGSK